MTTVYKCHFHYTLTTPPIDYNVYQIMMRQKICEVFDSLPGVTNIVPFTTPGESGTCYATYNLTGGNKSQFALTTYYGSGYWGICSDDHNWSSYAIPNIQYYLMQNGGEDYDYDISFIVRDNRLIACVHDFCGYWIFHTTTDGDLVVETPGQTSKYNLGYGYLTRNNGSFIFNPDKLTGTSGNAQAWIGENISGISINAGNFNLPADKMIRFSNIYCDRTRSAMKQIEDYPLGMYGAGVPCAVPQDPMFKKVIIDSKKYIHVGSLNWIEYDNIIENTYNVGV